MASLKLVLDVRREKGNGTYPVVFRLTHLCKCATIPTSLSLEKSDWDAKKEKVKKSNPSWEELNHELSKYRLKYQEELLKVGNTENDVTVLKRTLLGKEKTERLDFFSFSNQLIKKLIATNKIGNATVYSCAVNSLKNFTKNPKLKFEEVDYKLLSDYEAHLIKKELKVNSIANYMRTIRAIFNKAIKTNNVGIEHYPFRNYSVKHERTFAKVLNKEQIAKITKLKIDKASPEYISRAVFLLTFYLIGISFADLVTLKKTDVIDGRVVYRRKKTKRMYSIKLHRQAREIITELSLMHPESIYLIPLLPDYKLTPIEEKRTIALRLQTCNKFLKRIGNDSSLNLTLTTYVARYSWATIAKRLGYSNEVIAEALGKE